MEFLKNITDHEHANKMNAYNLAVTVGPNIFRPKRNTAVDILNVGIFYDLLIRMIENHQELFDQELSFEQMIERRAAGS